jgi:hypothetical protein
VLQSHKRSIGAKKSVSGGGAAVDVRTVQNGVEEGLRGPQSGPRRLQEEGRGIASLLLLLRGILVSVCVSVCVCVCDSR